MSKIDVDEAMEKLLAAADRQLPEGEKSGLIKTGQDEVLVYAAAMAACWSEQDEEARSQHLNILRSLMFSPPFLTALVMDALVALMLDGQCDRTRLSQLTRDLMALTPSAFGVGEPQ